MARKINIGALFIALCLSTPVYAAIAILDAPASNELEDCDPCAVNMTISAGSDRIFMCAVGAEDSSSPAATAVTFNSIAMSSAIAATTPTASNSIELWYLLDASLPAPGTYSVSVDFADSTIDFGITCWSVSGAAQGPPKDTDLFTSDSTNTATLSLSGVVISDWTFTAAIFNNTGATWTHGTDQTEMSDFAFGAATASVVMSTTREGGEAAPSSTAAGSANRFAMVAAVWAEAGAAAVPSVIPRRRAQ